METFGPQLVGETEKVLNALLHRVIEGTGLTEPQWVTMRLAYAEPSANPAELVARAADRARFEDADELVATLTERGLLSGGPPTDAGRALLEDRLAYIETFRDRIWGDLPDADAAARALATVRDRVRAVLG